MEARRASVSLPGLRPGGSGEPAGASSNQQEDWVFPGTQLPKGTFIRGGSVQRKGENPMKSMVSVLNIRFAIAIAFTGPAFAGPGSTITNKEDCEKAGKVWDEAGKKCVEKQ